MTYDTPQIAVSPIGPGALPSLAESKLARFSAAIILYFLQGVPIGLGLIAIPAWLASNGATPVQVGAYVGTAFLPWSLKLVNGLVMDRFAFKPMGRRRGWILLAQSFMALTLLGVALIAPGPQDIALLTACVFALNVCATFNDVATDGMVVDIVPEEERPLLNSLMFASQGVGFATVGFIGGLLLVDGSISTAALIFGAFVAMASAFVALFRERPGERLLPWTLGEASSECIERQQGAMWPIIKGVAKGTFKPRALTFILAVGLAMGSGSFIDAVASTLAVQQLGWAGDAYSNFASAVSLICSLAAVLFAAPAVKAFGLRNALIGTFFLHIAMALIAALSYPSWEGDWIFMSIYCVQYIAHQLTLTFACVWFMKLSDPAVAASQFALFNAAPTLMRSFYSGNSGFVIEWGGYQAIYFAIAVMASVGLVFALLSRVGNTREAD